MNASAPSPRNRRAISLSPDGASNWSPTKFDETLVDPICAAGLVRIPRKRGPALWVFSNPDGKQQRNLTQRFSRDEGRTWTKGPVLEPGPSAIPTSLH